jgi:ABC-type branched-subunit amino acid transport system substrate-binding protein/tetratricopeptide (TPR) repeat protein
VTNKNNKKNPYIIGKPIHEPEKLFGREDLFQFIEDNLNSDTKILLLHGQRRIGKSSVLEQIAHRIDRQEFVFVCFDLQGHSQSSLSDILYNLAEKIAEKLSIDSDTTILPSQEKFKSNPHIFFDGFLLKVYCELGDKNLVLLLDEFDVLSSNDNIIYQGESFFRYLQSLIKQQKNLFVIAVLGRSKDDFKNLSQLFNSPPFQEVHLLRELSARRLIIKPAEGILKYEEDAIKAILELSSGHPYFTQAICFNLFLQARIEDKWKVTRSDVQGIVDKTIESATGGLAWFWDGLSIDEKVVFSAVAEAKKIAIEQKQSFPEDPLTLLKKYGVIPTNELIQAGKKLTVNGFLDDTERRVKIELVRRWIVECRPLKKMIWVLEEFEQLEINKISKEATKLYQNSQKNDAINCYKKILKLNPNHFSTLPILADRYLEIDEFDKAMKLYHQAYKIDSILNKEGFLLALEAYGNNGIKQREFIKAKVQFEEVLKIEPDRESAKYKLREIEAEIDQQQKLDNKKAEIYKQQLEIESLRNQKTLIRQPLVLCTIALLIALVGGSIGIRTYQPLTSCYEGQKKVNGSCVSILTSLPNDNIHRYISVGDRTLFTAIPNTSRDQAIEAFKKGHYPQAVELFATAVTYNRNDPEVRIYYNNAKAIDNAKRGEEYSPLILAVVVSGNNQSNAQEILRGVAQSQEQFNVNGGQNGRLLEILIANDADDEEQAQKIAENLVKKESLLGVIGHGSSKTTQAALNIYKRANIPIISPTSSANTLQGKNFFRTTPSDAAFGEKLGEYATNSSLKKVIIFYNPTSNYSKSLKEEFRKNFPGQIFRLIDLTDPQLNIEQELNESASQQVQAVMLFPDIQYTATAIDVARVNVNNNLRLKLLGDDTLYNNKTLEDGKNVEGLVLAVPWFREAPQAKDFSQAAKQQWEGDISWRTATSYDATQAFIQSLSSRPSRAGILQRLQNLNLSPRLTSGDDLKFKNGEPQSKAILVTVEQSQFRCLQQCSP